MVTSYSPKVKTRKIHVYPFNIMLHVYWLMRTLNHTAFSKGPTCTLELKENKDNSDLRVSLLGSCGNLILQLLPYPGPLLGTNPVIQHKSTKTQWSAQQGLQPMEVWSLSRGHQIQHTGEVVEKQRLARSEECKGISLLPTSSLYHRSRPQLHCWKPLPALAFQGEIHSIWEINTH